MENNLKIVIFKEKLARFRLQETNNFFRPYKNNINLV